ncbi:MAG: hypothetical protein RIR49_2193 [Actinomycetota bacterium]
MRARLPGSDPGDRGRVVSLPAPVVDPDPVGSRHVPAVARVVPAVVPAAVVPAAVPVVARAASGAHRGVRSVAVVATRTSSSRST